MGIVGTVIVVVLVVFVVVLIYKSVHLIGPTEVGLVNKRFAFRKLPEDNPIAFHHEAGYQAELLMPGLRIKLWPIFAVQKHPWVQVPAGEIGVVIAQVGAALPIGAKSGVYQDVFGNFSNLRQFIELGGQKGVQRPVLPPGTLMPVHPVAFLVLTPQAVYGLPVAPDLVAATKASGGILNPVSLGLDPAQLRVVIIAPQGPLDMVGIVTVLEGEPLPSRRHREPARRLRRHRADGGRDRDGRGRDRREGHRGPARLEERAAQQLPGLPGVPRARRQDRPAARPAALRRVPAEPVPRAGRDGADARGEPGRGRGHQGVRRSADARHVGHRVQVRLDRAARAPRDLAGAAAHRQVPDQPALLRGGDRPDVDPHAQLVQGDERVAQPRRAARADRRQEP